MGIERSGRAVRAKKPYSTPLRLPRKIPIKVKTSPTEASDVGRPCVQVKKKREKSVFAEVTSGKKRGGEFQG